MRRHDRSVSPVRSGSISSPPRRSPPRVQNVRRGSLIQSSSAAESSSQPPEAPEDILDRDRQIDSSVVNEDDESTMIESREVFNLLFPFLFLAYVPLWLLLRLVVKFSFFSSFPFQILSL